MVSTYKRGQCAICLGIHLSSINILLREGRSLTAISQDFPYTFNAIKRHVQRCGVTKGDLTNLKKKYMEEMGQAMPVAEDHRLPSTIEAKRVELNVSTLSENIKVLYISCLEVMAECEETGKHALRLAAIREARQILEVVMKATSVFLEDNTDTDWKDVLDIVLKALEPFPEAKLAVSKALNNNL